jgi:hypothetical protein
LLNWKCVLPVERRQLKNKKLRLTFGPEIVNSSGGLTGLLEAETFGVAQLPRYNVIVSERVVIRFPAPKGTIPDAGDSKTQERRSQLKFQRQQLFDERAGFYFKHLSHLQHSQKNETLLLLTTQPNNFIPLF